MGLRASKVAAEPAGRALELTGVAKELAESLGARRVFTCDNSKRVLAA